MSIYCTIRMIHRYNTIHEHLQYETFCTRYDTYRVSYDTNNYDYIIENNVRL